MGIQPFLWRAKDGIKASARQYLFEGNPPAMLQNWMAPRSGEGYATRQFHTGSSPGNFNVRDWANTALNVSMGTGHAAPPDLSTTDANYLISKGFHKRTGSYTQLPAYVLVTQPSQTTINDRVLLIADAYNIASAFAALGDTFEVEIDGAATFRWRVNGGAWTAGVAIATAVTVGTYYNLYFLATTGFTIGRNWVWRRTDSFLETSTTVAGPPGRICRSGNDYFFVGYGNLLGRAYFGRSGSTNGNTVARSLGYRRCYGQHVIVFQNHLFVAGFTETSSLLPSVKLTFSWSDLNDLDNFLATDVNEADSYTISGLNPGAFAEEKITGWAVWGNALYTFTQTSIHRTIYTGLPSVMYTEKVTDQLGCVSDGGVVVTAKGIYFPGYDGFYRFDGGSFELISGEQENIFQTFNTLLPYALPGLFYKSSFGGVGCYSPRDSEVKWSVTADNYPGVGGWLCYKEASKQWSYQNVPSSTVVSSRHQCFYRGDTSVGVIYEFVTGDDSFYVPNTSFPGSTPTQEIITNIFRYSNDPGKVLELQDLWVDILLQSGAVLTGYYQAGNKQSDIDLRTSASWTSMGTFDTTSRRFPNVRVNFKYIAFRFVVTNTSSTDANNIFFGFIPYIYGLPDPAAK